MEDKKTIDLAERGKSTLIKPLVSPQDLIEHHKEITNLIGKALKKGQDYGVIPGSGTKPTLLKPGAERIAIAFGVAPLYSIIETEVDHHREVEWKKRKKKWRNAHQGDRHFDWVETTGTARGIYRYVVRCDLQHQVTNKVIGSGIGTCSSMESKYIDRPRDTENTIAKMAQKRALVAAVLSTFGLSDRFTQDLEDIQDNGEKFSPQQKADAESSPAAQLWAKKAKPRGVPAEEWKAWCQEIGIKRDLRSQSAQHMADLEARVDEWISAAAESAEATEAQDAAEDPKLFVDDEMIAWLRSTADASSLDIDGARGLIAFAKSVTGNKSLKSLKHLTRDEFDVVMEAINNQSAERSAE